METYGFKGHEEQAGKTHYAKMQLKHRRKVGKLYYANGGINRQVVMEF
jgi:hypothetical protein